MSFESNSEPSLKRVQLDRTVSERKDIRSSQYSSSSGRFYASHRIFNEKISPVAIDRSTYKLRMKSDLNVKMLNDRDRFRRRRFPSGNFRENKMKSASFRPVENRSNIVEEQFNGIEGNAVHVGTLDDLINQFRRAELRLFQRPTEKSRRNSLAQPVPRSTRTNSSERSIKRAQAITEYQFPLLPREKLADFHFQEINVDERARFSSSIARRERQSTATTSTTKFRMKFDSSSIDRPIYSCSKLTIADPFQPFVEPNDNCSIISQAGTNSYIFPPIRSSGYFTKKNLQQQNNGATPFPDKTDRTRKIKKTKKKQNSFESLENFSTEQENSQFFSENVKSMISLASSETDHENPANTVILLAPSPI